VVYSVTWVKAEIKISARPDRATRSSVALDVVVDVDLVIGEHH
jgi:hypothetical protein